MSADYEQIVKVGAKIDQMNNEIAAHEKSIERDTKDIELCQLSIAARKADISRHEHRIQAALDSIVQTKERRETATSTLRRLCGQD